MVPESYKKKKKEEEERKQPVRFPQNDLLLRDHFKCMIRCNEIVLRHSKHCS